MSKVISFRLNPENPRDAEALTILNNLASQGYSVRYTMTEAILNLSSKKSKDIDNQGLNALLIQIKEILEDLKLVSQCKMQNDHNLSMKKLSDGFLSSIIKSAEPGLGYKE
jgi:hypothetical protein